MADDPQPPSFPPPGGPPSGGPPPGSPPPPSGAPQPGAPPPAGEPGAFPPPSGAPAPYQSAASPAFGSYPAEYDADYPQAGIARWRCFFQGFLLIPHFIVLCFVGLAAYFAFVYAWFAVLFTGRYPRGAFNFIAGTLNWANRVTGYSYLMTERYPPFSLRDDPAYPIRSRFRYPEGGIANWRAPVHWLMLIPHYVVLYLLGIGATLALIFAWFAILFTRVYPPGAFQFIAGVQRWNLRVIAYYLLMTEEYPPFSLA